jgi:hypothetical protein
VLRESSVGVGFSLSPNLKVQTSALSENINNTSLAEEKEAEQVGVAF